MIVNKYANGGGGSTSGVTPQDVQQQINSALAPYWESGETKDYVDSAVSGISLDGYYTSAQTEEAIAEAVEGYATSGDMQSAFTLISETQQVAAAGLNQLEGRIDELSAATPSVDLSGYYTSAQTEEAISAATSGKADKANVLPNYGALKFPAWNADGIIGGEVSTVHASSNFYLNGTKREPIFSRLVDAETRIDIYTPQSAGTAGDILVSTGNGAPVWSSVTIPDMSGYYTSAQTEEAISAATSGKADAKILVDFDHTTQAERAAVYAELKALYDGGSGATINKNYDFYKTVNTWQGQKIDYYTFSGDTLVFGQVVSPENLEDQVAYVQVMEIDSAGNVTVQTNTIGAADMSGYYTSAQTDEKITEAVSGLATEQYVQDALSGVNMDNYYTSAQTEDAITSKNYITSAQVETQIVSKNYITSAEIADFVTSAQVETQIEAKNYVNSGDVKSQVEAYNYATVSQIPTVPTSNTAFTNDAGYITDAAIENLVTSAQVETQIDTKAAAYTPTSGFSTINGSAITNGGNIVIEGGADMSGYWNSAETLDAISAATSGKADAANVSGNTSNRYFPAWNEQGIITGITDTVPVRTGYLGINGTGFTIYSRNISLGNIYGPQSAGTAGDILVSTGKGAPVWSAVTFPDVSNYVTSAQVETQIVEKNYVTSAQVETQITSKGYATVSQIPTVPTSNTAFTNDAGYVTSAQVETQIVEKNYITSAAIADKVSSTYVSTIWKGTQAEYDDIPTKDPNTFYIIVNN